MGRITDILADDLKEAMRARDSVRLRTVRSLRAALKAAEIDRRQGGQATLSEHDELAILQKQAKQRREAMTQFENAGREDLYEQEKSELEIIESYLPQMMTRQEITEVVGAVIARTGASSRSDMGKVMGAVMPEVRGRADGNLVREVVADLLES